MCVDEQYTVMKKNRKNLNTLLLSLSILFSLPHSSHYSCDSLVYSFFCNSFLEFITLFSDWFFVSLIHWHQIHVIAAPESFVLLKISRLCENSLEAKLKDDAKEIKHYNLKTKKWIDAKSFKYRHELDIFLQFLIHFQMLSFILTNQTFIFEFLNHQKKQQKP